MCSKSKHRRSYASYRAALAAAALAFGDGNYPGYERRCASVAKRFGIDVSDVERDAQDFDFSFAVPAA